MTCSYNSISTAITTSSSSQGINPSRQSAVRSPQSAVRIPGHPYPVSCLDRRATVRRLRLSRWCVVVGRLLDVGDNIIASGPAALDEPNDEKNPGDNLGQAGNHEASDSAVEEPIVAGAVVIAIATSRRCVSRVAGCPCSQQTSTDNGEDDGDDEEG